MERTLAENQNIPLSNLQVLKVLDCSHLCTMSKKFTCKMSDTGLKVIESHMYFYQVQQQLFVVNRLWGVLAILGSYGEFFHEEIAFSQSGGRSIEQFYDKYIIYELAYPRIRDGLTRYDYG